MMYGHTDLKKGVAIQIDGAPHLVLESSHIAMGRGGAVMRTKLKNLVNGAIFDRSFRASDKIESADMSRVNMQYLYSDDDAHYFMDQNSFEQVGLNHDVVGDAARYLVGEAKVIILHFNDQPIGIDIGNNVVLTITQTEPGVKGDTATTALKPAITETGLEVMVPLFINEGDAIKVDTRDGRYLERHK
ncbi:elongation factor P [Patescibacteria group bacterium]|nr:MAG: elongation factor P [Patescibacteria group bacterium]